MDIDLYRQLIGRFWGVLVAILVVTTVGSLLFAATRPTSYQGSVYLSIAQAPELPGNTTDVYQYGEFYAIQGSNFLADYFRGWLRDPATVEEILTRAGGGLPKGTLTSISRFFNAKSLGTVGLQIFHTTSSEGETERVLTETQAVLAERLESLQAQGFYQDFAIVPGKVLVRAVEPNFGLVGAIGFGSGLILAVFALLLLAVVTPDRLPAGRQGKHE